MKLRHWSGHRRPAPGVGMYTGKTVTALILISRWKHWPVCIVRYCDTAAPAKIHYACFYLSTLSDLGLKSISLRPNVHQNMSQMLYICVRLVGKKSSIAVASAKKSSLLACGNLPQNKEKGEFNICFERAVTILRSNYKCLWNPIILT